MTVTILKRQYITDALGRRIGVILPIEEYALIEKMLNQRLQTTPEPDKIAEMTKAVQDPLFMADLEETMAAFAEVDAEWWESETE